MYQVKCDDYILYDPRDDDFVLLNPKYNLEVNKVGSASFTILPTHPNFKKLQKLRSVIEIKENNDIIFRGRITTDVKPIDNRLNVDVEGVLAYTNDTIIPPFDFPSGFSEAETAENVVEYFLGWILEQHNAQADDFQKLKLGTVTVSDPNNYITRSSTVYASTWDTIKSKLFDSGLGGYLLIRHESDGNYVDYLETFSLTNTQHIVYGENLRDITQKADATSTYSAIFPRGAEVESDNGKYTITLESLADGDLTDDLVKEGKYIWSRSARAMYGWICMPLSKTVWKDVTTTTNLQNKAIEALTGDGMLISNTQTFKAVDLHFTDTQIQTFRAFRNVVVESSVHGVDRVTYPLTKLSGDILNPQNTTITVGSTIRSLVDINDKKHSETIERVESAEQDISENRSEVSEVREQVLTQSTQIVNDCEQIILSALESYVETSDYDQFKETVEAQLQVMSDNITMTFSKATEQIEDVNGDLQSTLQTLNKYFEFTADGLTIKAGENAMNLMLDNDIIKFLKNGQQFGWWDGVDFHTGNIVVNVNERAQFGNFAFVPRSDGSLSFLKVGD